MSRKRIKTKKQTTTRTENTNLTLGKTTKHPNHQHKSPKPDTKQGICDKQSATQILTASK